MFASLIVIYHCVFSENVATAITLIHSYMLHENDQIPWTGNSNPSLFSEKADEAGEINYASRDVGPAKFPYCKDISQV